MDLSTLVLTLHGCTLALLLVFGLHRLSLLARFRWRAGGEEPPPRRAEEELPIVTVQLPLYDERTVAARLLRCAAELDWPRERLELLVLDDSTDETRAIVDAEVARLRARGVDAQVLRRGDRAGFKAGALAHGMQRARGELLCVFDADFLPPRDFLRRLVPLLDDPRVGMVQARWEHENRDESALTRAEATLLDGHFVIEHTVRHDGGHFFNFNGTAGIWRRAAIEDAGGWQHDTLTEDLDLSYRAQLAGWRFVYAPLVTAPAELPPDIAGFKSQQHRWAKGGAQVLRKLGPRLLRARLPLATKVEAFAHLAGNVGYPCVLALALLLPLTATEPAWLAQAAHALLFVGCTASVLAFYEASQRALGRPLRARLLDTLLAVALGIGMSLAQTRAVAAGLLGATGSFARTPKRGGGGPGYRAAQRGLPGAELAVALWLAWGAVRAVAAEAHGALPFLLLFAAGFGWVGSLSLAAHLRVLGERRAASRPPQRVGRDRTRRAAAGLAGRARGMLRAR